MAYFNKYYPRLRYPIETSRSKGYREAQLAAIHAVNSHLYSRPDVPAIVVMPTGSGKTLILNSLAFTQRAKRVLVITPSRLVREQIVEGFQTLGDLLAIQALKNPIVKPSVHNLERTLKNKTDWRKLKEYDVVVAIPRSFSQTLSEMPPDLFDLILVDEAHHSPAKTWSQLLSHFNQAKQVLFTATPFRRDEKEIRGHFAFTYDLNRAFKDRVFGEILFEPVSVDPGGDIDVAIAQATEKKFIEDKKLKLKHLVMVRCDSLKRAKTIEAIYQKHTKLQLAFVKGQDSLTYVKSVIQSLKSNELDGVICVNMFGEGFNLPNLKIAAVHSPHKSLAITLQFIGRFARTSASHIGQATFLAEPQSSSQEIQGLYESGAIWKDIIVNLSATKVDDQASLKEILDTFAVDSTPDMEDFSLYTIRPYFHVKVFKSTSNIDLTVLPTFPSGLQVIFTGLSKEHGATIYITRERNRCRWSTDDRFVDVAYDLFIFHTYGEHLFICSSRRTDILYSQLAEPILDGKPQIVPYSIISRALNDIDASEFFNVGMRKRNRLGNSDSYRTLTGPSADKSVKPTDNIMYDRGHVFGTGVENGNSITIGVSPASKVWSNTYDRVPILLGWCNKIADKINSGRNLKTGSKLDYLSTGELLDQLPDGIIAMIWNRSTYDDPPIVYVNGPNDTNIEHNLLDFDCNIIESNQGWVKFELYHSNVRWIGLFALSEHTVTIDKCDDLQPTLYIKKQRSDLTIEQYLRELLPTFYCQDLSSIEGPTIYRIPSDPAPFPDEHIEKVDWAKENVNITQEKPTTKTGDGISIFQWLESRLISSSAQVVFCDDGSGEMADYISISNVDEIVTVDFYHCKATKKLKSNKVRNNVQDLYDVCGQVIKCNFWFKPDLILNKLRHRVTLPSIKGFCKGNIDDVKDLLSIKYRQNIRYNIIVVQPGISKDSRTTEISSMLASANHWLRDSGISEFTVIGS